ncbi:MAG: radical SAM protein [Candidatus Pacebacteria bacterium]|nr:radical SAM protein [Candidatus Paceibacterota bacterium]
MKGILLINPAFNIAKENYDSSVSVGLLSIASYLKSKGIPVKIIDAARQKNYRKLIEKEAVDFDYVGLSVMTTQIPSAFEIAEIVRKVNPAAKIVWGGPHPTFFARQTAENSLVDIVCNGEGEEVAYEILSGKELKSINGIVFKDNADVIVNPPHELHDPSKMPLFNWDLIEEDVLKNLKLIPSLTSRGCPHRCTFCINAILKNKWRPRTVDQVLDDLRKIKSKKFFQGKNLRFWDENFFVDIIRAKKIIEGIIREDIIIPWETTVRANYLQNGMIDDDFLKKLKQSGCYLLSFGAESGCPRMLNVMKKDISPEDILRAAEMSLRHGIVPQFSFMIGLPGESKSDMFATLRLIDKLVKFGDKIQILGPQAFRPYPGSELYEECLKAGWKEPLSLEEWGNLAKDELNYLSVKNFPWVKDKDFVESMEAYVRFGAHSFKSAIGSSVKAPFFIKLGFVLLCKFRWKLKFFFFPFEFKIAKMFLTK